MNDTDDALDVALRDLLEAEAATYEVPPSLAERTLEAARRAAAEPRRVVGSRPARGLPSRRRAWPLLAAAAAGLLLTAGVVERSTHRSAEVATSVATTTTAAAVTTNREMVDAAVASAGDGVAAGTPLPLAAGASTSADSSIGTSGAGASAGALAAGPAAPAVIRSAEISVQVDRGTFAARWRQANAIPAQHGGFVLTSNAETTAGVLASGSLTARIPVKELDATVAQLRELGTPTRVTDAGRDVSGQLGDYDARIANVRAGEAQLLELLKGARTTGAVNEIRGRLDGTRNEIEALQAERARLQSQVDLATLQVGVTEPLGPPPPPPPPPVRGRWSAAFHDAGDGVVTVAAGLVVGAGYVAPLAVVLAVIWVTRRRLRRRALES